MITEQPTCQYGQLTKTEYQRGVRRERCSNPSTTAVERKSESGTTYVVYLCNVHSSI